MIRRWIDDDQHIGAALSISRDKVHIHTEINGSSYGVNVAPDEAAVLADYAAQTGHPAAGEIASVWRAVQGGQTNTNR